MIVCPYNGRQTTGQSKSYETCNCAWLSLKHAKVKVRHTGLLTICIHLSEALEQANLIYTHRKWLLEVGVGLTENSKGEHFGEIEMSFS